MQPAIALHSVPTDPIDEEHLAAVYRYAASHAGIGDYTDVAADLGIAPDAVGSAVEQLLDNRLLRRTRGADALLVAVDPDVAAAVLVSPIEREIYRSRELIAQVAERTERYRADFSAADGRSGGDGGTGRIEHLTGTMEVRGYLKVLSESCHDEVLVVRSGKQDADDFNDLLGVCGQLLSGGVAVRIVCLHRSRGDLVIRTKLNRLTEAGAEIRTLSHIPRSAVVFDRAKAVLLDSAGSADGETTAACVRDDDVAVPFLLDLFEHLWETAAPIDIAEHGYAEVADDLQRSIVSLLALGLTDEVVARKLGMSVRSVRRHIASLLQDLGAVSRFQAGVQAGRNSLVNAS